MKKYYMTKPRAVAVEELEKPRALRYCGRRVFLKKGDFVVKDATGRLHPFTRDLFLKTHYEITEDVYNDEKRKAAERVS